MKPILTSLSPNTERDDVLAAFKLLWTPWRWRREQATHAATEKLSLFFQSPVVLVSSGRAALAALLQAWGIGKGDEVILQAFTCVAVPAPIIWNEATPVYADINPATYNLDINDVRKKITSRTRAIIVQHTFGIPGPLQELIELSARHKIFLIEDIAHALGATLDGKPLGSFGDAAIVSFGRDKVLSSVFGGAVVSRHRAVIETIRRTQVALPYPPYWWVMQQLLHPLLMVIVKSLYFIGIGKAVLVAAQKIGLLSKAVLPAEKKANRPPHIVWRYSPALAHLLAVQVAKLPRYTKRRQQIANQYARALTIAVRQPHSSPSWLRFPLRIDKPKVIQRQARALHMLLGDWYDAPVAPAEGAYDRFHYIPGSCPEAEKASREVINLPTYPTLSDAAVARVIAFITSQLHR